jgi:hypothetical protein
VDGVELHIIEGLALLETLVVLFINPILPRLVHFGILNIIACTEAEQILMTAQESVYRIVDGVEPHILMEFVYLLIGPDRRMLVNIGKVEATVCIREDRALVLVLILGCVSGVTILASVYPEALQIVNL